MSASAPTWLLVAIPAVLLALMLLVVVCAVVLAGRADKRLEELSGSLPRYGAGGSGPEPPVRADAMAEFDVELARMRWEWPQ